MKNNVIVVLSILYTSTNFFAQNAVQDRLSKKMSVEQIQDDISFWAGQLQEHAEFGADFVTDRLLKKKGTDLAQEFASIKNGTHDQERQKNFLSAAQKLGKYLSDVQVSLRDHHEPKNSIKWDLINHMKLENGYAQDKARGKVFTRKEEVKFWSEEHEGEAKATAYFLKSETGNLKIEAQELAKRLQKNAHRWINTDIQLVEDANKELDMIGAALKKDPSQTNMPQKLANHEKRERERAIQTLKKMEGQP